MEQVQILIYDGGDVLTAGGVTAAIDLALTSFGASVAAAVAGARRIEHRPQGPVVEVMRSEGLV